MSDDLQDLFDNNRRWASELESRQPGFFQRLQQQQSPRYLWIGCADSRVPANELVGLMPGELFVHRNVANVVVPSDLNALSVLQFALDMLQVEHVIVVGHSNCGGVRAALQNQRVGLADNWLRHVQDVRNAHNGLLDAMPEAQRLDALCQLNVLEQVRNLCRTTVLEDAWRRGQTVAVHGWVYGLHNGLLQDLRVTIDQADAMTPVYTDALAALRRRFELDAAASADARA